MGKKELLKRYILLFAALFFMGIGIAFAKYGELGVTPISSVPNVISFKFTALSMGSWLTIWNIILMAGQVLLLGKKTGPMLLLQFPVAFILGWFTDFGLWMLSFVSNEAYAVKLIMVFLGTVILGFGIALSFVANVVLNPGEAFVKALAETIKKDLGNVKICFDVGCVLLSVILSLIFFNFKIVGTREGTIFAAFGVGTVVKWFVKRIEKPINSMLK